MSLLLADQYPVVMMILTTITILFVLQYMRKAERMLFEKRVHLLKIAAGIALLLLVCGYGIRIILTLFFSIEYFKISFGAGCIILYDPLVRIVYGIMIFKIFKFSLNILNNFSKLEVFKQQNVELLTALNQRIMQLLALRIIVNIIYCVFVIVIDTSTNHAYGSLNANFDSMFGILSLFILMLIVSAVTTIYTKAVEQYNENSLII